MVKNVSHMRFPRYLKSDYRDFFYLVLKTVMPGPGEWRTAGLVGNSVYPPGIAQSRKDERVLRVDPKRFVAHVVPASNDPLAPFNPVDSKALTLGLVMPDAVLHRCSRINLRPIPPGTKVLAIDARGTMQFITWDPALVEKYPYLLSAGGSVNQSGPFLDFRPGAMMGYKREGNQLIEGPISGGDGNVVTRLSGTDLRILLSLKKGLTDGFRF